MRFFNSLETEAIDKLGCLAIMVDNVFFAIIDDFK